MMVHESTLNWSYVCQDDVNVDVFDSSKMLKEV